MILFQWINSQTNLLLLCPNQNKKPISLINSNLESKTKKSRLRSRIQCKTIIQESFQYHWVALQLKKNKNSQAMMDSTVKDLIHLPYITKKINPCKDKTEIHPEKIIIKIIDRTITMALSIHKPYQMKTKIQNLSTLFFRIPTEKPNLPSWNSSSSSAKSNTPSKLFASWCMLSSQLQYSPMSSIKTNKKNNSTKLFTPLNKSLSPSKSMESFLLSSVHKSTSSIEHGSCKRTTAS